MHPLAWQQKLQDFRLNAIRLNCNCRKMHCSNSSLFNSDILLNAVRILGAAFVIVNHPNEVQVKERKFVVPSSYSVQRGPLKMGGIYID
jgi:hypothetical protein